MSIMAQKPFVAARIPKDLNQKLLSHVEETGEDKTEVITKALAGYLGHTLKVETIGVTPEEFEDLKQRVIALEQGLQRRQKDQKTDNATDNKKDNKQLEIDNSPDNKVDKEVEAAPKVDLGETLMTNQEAAAFSGIKYNTVKGRHKNGNSIEVENIRLLPVKQGKKPLWRQKLINQNQASTD